MSSTTTNNRTPYSDEHLCTATYPGGDPDAGLMCDQDAAHLPGDHSALAEIAGNYRRRVHWSADGTVLPGTETRETHSVTRPFRVLVTGPRDAGDPNPLRAELDVCLDHLSTPSQRQDHPAHDPTGTNTVTRRIQNTTHDAQHPWPEEVMIQGNDRGVVLGGDSPYRTAFVEAFPPGTFLRGEGTTLAEAETACWEKYQTWRNCDGSGNGHGPYERRHYRNGAGYCTRCGAWMSQVFEPLPEEPPAAGERTLMERVFADRDPTAALEVLDAVARVDDLPQGPPSTPAESADVQPSPRSELPR